MSLFIPKKGDLFYYETKPFVEDISEVLVLRQIKSLRKVTYHYGSSTIHRCLGIDDYAIVYEIAANPNDEEKVGQKRSSIKDRILFHPVGPEVKEALGLLEGVDDSIPQLKMTEEKTSR